MISYFLLGFGTIKFNTDNPNTFLIADLSEVNKELQSLFYIDGYGAHGHIVNFKSEISAVDALFYLRNIGLEPDITSKNKIVSTGVEDNAKS